MRPTPAAAAVVLCLLVAGCGGGSKPREVEVAPGHVVEVEEPVKPTHGIVAGVVANDALYPIEGVTVRIVGLELNTTTDSIGRFAIVNVPAGIYIVEGSKKDHKSVQATVDVQPDRTAKAVLLLERIPPTDPYHITWSRDSFIQASAGVTTGRNTTLDLQLDPSRPRTLVLESSWEGAVLVPVSDRFLAYRLVTLDGREVVRDTSANPLAVHVDAGILPPGQPNLRFTAEPSSSEAATYQGRGQTFATVFYNEPAPADWSILAGDS